MSIFTELSIIILFVTVISVILHKLKQPLIIGYILTGIIAGPNILNLLQKQAEIEIFSKIGIAILLFIIGLNLSPRLIREVGKVAFISGLFQIILTIVYGFILL